MMTNEFGDFVGNKTGDIVKKLFIAGKAVTEVYRSSLLTENMWLGNPEDAMNKYASLLVMQPDWCGNIMALECRHCAVVPLYFLRAPENASIVYRQDNPPMSCLTDEATGSLVGLQWDQLGGKKTWDRADDTFQPMARPGTTKKVATPQHLCVMDPHPCQSYFCAMANLDPLARLAAGLLLVCFSGACIFVMCAREKPQQGQLRVMPEERWRDDESYESSEEGNLSARMPLVARTCVTGGCAGVDGATEADVADVQVAGISRPQEYARIDPETALRGDASFHSRQNVAAQPSWSLTTP